MNRPLHRPALPRRLVLAAAFVAGLAATAILAPSHPGTAAARDAALRAVVAEARAQAATTPPAAGEPAPAAKPDAPAVVAPKARVDAEITIDDSGVTVRKGKGERKGEVVVDDHEFESFEQFVEQAPWLAGLVFMVTALFFLVPLVVIVLVIWYKVRRTRMLNETMLKLAERGAVPPGEAMEAIATGRPGPSVANVPPGAPLYEQAKALRKRAAWSDLRKGVLLVGLGLGLVFYSMFEDGSPNAPGLVLLFVGIGYTVLWYFEGRDVRGRAEPPAGGA